MTVVRMDNVGIVVEDLDAAVAFFAELGLALEGRTTVEGDWADGVTGLRGMRVEIAMMRTPDGHGRLELSRFLAPPVVDDHRRAPVNALGYLRVMFAVEDIDDTVARLEKRGAKLVVEGEKGLEFAEVVETRPLVVKSCQTKGARRLVRFATREDESILERKPAREREALRFCMQKSRERNAVLLRAHLW